MNACILQVELRGVAGGCEGSGKEESRKMKLPFSKKRKTQRNRFRWLEAGDVKQTLSF